MNEKLREIRKLYLSQDKFSKKIAMHQTTYSRKENGKSPITDEEWNRFAAELNVPVEELKGLKPITVNNDNCTFADNSVNTVQFQYINIPKEVMDIVIKYNQLLEEENKIKEIKIKELEDEIHKNNIS